MGTRPESSDERNALLEELEKRVAGFQSAQIDAIVSIESMNIAERLWRLSESAELDPRVLSALGWFYFHRLSALRETPSDKQMRLFRELLERPRLEEFPYL
jgi:hypothetical protein